MHFSILKLHYYQGKIRDASVKSKIVLGLKKPFLYSLISHFLLAKSCIIFLY